MILPRRHFREFFAGRAGETVQVATLRHDTGLLMSAQTDRVMMGRLYAEKMLVKHRLTYEHLILFQLAIDRGYCFEGRVLNYIEFLYFDDTPKRNEYRLVLKSARWGQEVWFVSFYRTRFEQYRSIRRRQRLLREHL